MESAKHIATPVATTYCLDKDENGKSVELT